MKKRFFYWFNERKILRKKVELLEKELHLKNTHIVQAAEKVKALNLKVFQLELVKELQE